MPILVRALQQRLQDAGSECYADVPLKNYTTFRIGGSCRLMVVPHNTQELQQAVCILHQSGMASFILGNGSNLLVSDQGYDGAVIYTAAHLKQMRLQDGSSIVCQSGAMLSSLCRFAQRHGLTGLEFAYGIPGTVGGAVMMNAGAYGGQMQEIVEQTTHLTSAGEWGIFSKEQLDFAYRHSAYQNSGDCIVEVTVRLRPGDPAQIQQTMEELMQRRKRKQPLEFPSAGSTFKRPDGAYAAALIDQCGLKGVRIGDAQVSQKHAGFIINRGHATSADVQQLIKQVRQTVFKQTGFDLECEVLQIGKQESL